MGWYRPPVRIVTVNGGPPVKVGPIGTNYRWRWNHPLLLHFMHLLEDCGGELQIRRSELFPLFGEIPLDNLRTMLRRGVAYGAFDKFQVRRKLNIYGNYVWVGEPTIYRLLVSVDEWCDGVGEVAEWVACNVYCDRYRPRMTGARVAAREKREATEEARAERKRRAEVAKKTRARRKLTADPYGGYLPPAQPPAGWLGVK